MLPKLRYKNQKYFLKLYVGFFTLFFCEMASSEIDDVQTLMLKHYQQVLRWDNVRSNPEWIAGMVPRYSSRSRMYEIILKPGESIKVRVPKNEVLRIFSREKELTSDDLILDESQGSGLYARLIGSISVDKHNLLSLPDYKNAHLIVVSRAKNHHLPIKLALFISRHESLAELAPYRHLIQLNRPSSLMTSNDRAGSQRFWLLKPGQTEYVKVCSSRYAFENRLAYEGGESRLLQTYQLNASVDGTPLPVINFETSPETSFPIYVNGSVKVIGRLQTGYLNISKGCHTLAFNVTAKMYGRLLEQSNSDYLFPTLNQPKVSPQSVIAQLHPLKTNIWNLNKTEIRHNVLSNSVSPTEKEQTAYRIVRDNNHREGGVLGTVVMKNSAKANVDYPEIQAVASELEGYHTFYRDVFPNTKQYGTNQYMAWFLVPSLHQIGEQGKKIVAGKQFLQALLDRLASGYFFELPNATHAVTNNQLTYYLPANSAPSTLRITIDSEKTSENEAFYVQVGDEKPVLFHNLIHQELPSKEYVITQADAGLSILSQLPDEVLHSTLSGQFSHSRVNAPLIKANIFELPVPSGVREIKIWKASQEDGHLFVALQYRVSKPFLLSEIEYDEMVRQSQPTEAYAIFKQMLKNQQVKNQTVPEKELFNNWLPLQRFINENNNIFSSMVARDKQNGKHSDAILSKNLASQVKIAEKATARGEWMQSLEMWKNIKNEGNAYYRRKAQKQIINSLNKLGEHYLAELQLRSILLYSKDPVLKSWAYNKLSAFYQSNHDVNSLVMMSASMVMMDPSIIHLQYLFHALIENNQYELALMVGKLIPAKQQNTEDMLRAAYQLGWWETYDALSANLAQSCDRAYWLGIKLLAQGDVNHALDEFKMAGQKGAVWRNQIIDGRKILKSILSTDLNARTQGIHAWQKWQSKQPGYFMWQEDPSVVRDSLGVKTLYSINRNIYSNAFEGSHHKPIHLLIAGPVSVRLEARLVLSAEQKKPIDAWLSVGENNIFRRFSIDNATPAQGIQLIGQPGLMAGNKVYADFDLGPGLHNLTVNTDNLPFLLRAFIYRPEMPIPVLPPLSADTLNAAYRNKLKSSKTDSSLVVIIPEPKKIISDINVTACSTQSREYRAIYKNPQINQVNQLLWEIEHNSEKRLSAIMQAAYLVNAYPHLSELQSLKDRLARHTQWLSITNVEQSAGMRYIEEKGWEPETPALRIRKALLSPVNQDEHVLSGYDQLVYALKNLRPSTVLVKLKAEDVSSVPHVPLIATYQLDHGDLHKITLYPDAKEKIVPITVSDGSHAIRLKIANPVANQFLRASFTETRSVPSLTTVERGYFVATRNEPLIFSIAAPAYIRIDELRDGSIFSRYELIKAKRKQITLEPKKNRTEALFRISQITYAKKINVVRPRNITISNKKVPGPYVNLDQKSEAKPIILHDGLSLHGQENGTWSFTVSGNRRKNFLQNANENSSLTMEDYIEPKITHRYFSENKRTYFKTSVLEHIRKYGGAVIGAKESIFYQPIWYPINLRLNASAFYQDPNGNEFIGLSHQGEWSGTAVAAISQIRHLSPMSYHIPEVSVLFRHLSLANTSQYNSRYVDQDIFTTYQYNHQKYIEISDVYYYKPWLDSLPYIAGSFASAPSFNLFHPDNVKFDMGWKQLIGNFTLDPNFQWAQYIADDFLRRTYGLNIGWSKWTDSENHFEINFNISRGIDVPVTTGIISLTWNISDGRGYRDYQPGEIDFLNIRTRNIPSEPNNSMQGD